MVRGVEAEVGPFPEAHLRAMREVPRDRFVRAEDRDRAELDMPLPLDDAQTATISAPHAYLLSYRLLDLAARDNLLELGSGTGYGAALASEIVGPTGSVVTIEIDAALSERARELLHDRANVRALWGDAMDAASLVAQHDRIACTFAVKELPIRWCDALRPHAVLVAPVGGDRQELVRVTRDEALGLVMSRHGAVRYVRNRSISAA
jgi:protein-L-isoaspartate(D-aspartate) O-methyltransferase